MHRIQTLQPDGFWFVSGAAALWGTIGVITQMIYNIDSTTFMFINLSRVLIATPVLLVACWRMGGRAMFSIPRRDFGVMALGGTLMAISQVSYFAALQATGISIATLLTICLSPLVTMCFGVLLKLETLTWRTAFALALALIGSALLVFGGGGQSPTGTEYNVVLGAVFSFVSAAGYAGVVICGRFLAGNYHPLQITAVNFGAGTLVLILINTITGFVLLHTAQGWLLLLYLGLIPTALAYWLFQTGLRSVSATAATIISMAEPLVAALLAWALFGETLATIGIIGAGLLILSIFFVSTKSEGGS
jgi:drug/metabolite transporter, DME family